MKASSLFRHLTIFLFLSYGSLTAQIGPAVKPPGHPRLLLLRGEEEAIRQTVRTDKTWEKVHGAILTECDGLLSVRPVERIQIGRRLLDKSREALRRIFYLSYAWRTTRQEKYLKRATDELRAVSAMSDWNPSHFLDVAEMTMAAAIGYDWLYADLSEQNRALIREAIVKKGIEPSLDSRHNSWLTATHNWNQVCNAGMAYGALAVYEDHPELANRIVNRAITSMVLPMKDYSPDGAYPEGYGYWGYGTSFNVLFISALEKAFGSDFGLSAQPGFLKTAGYLENMTGPSGASFNYSDAGTGGELQPTMFWFAAKLKDPSLLWVERSHLLNDEAGRFVKNRILPAVMIWGNGIGIKAVPAPKSTLWSGGGKNPVALMRSSWTDPKAVFVGLKGGSPSVNHAHMDVGSFVMEADGVRWAMDFGMQEYNSLESKGVDLWNKTQNSQRWDIFRYNNLTHNTLTVNGEYQRVEGYAPITGTGSRPLFLSATTNLSEVYKTGLAKADRGIAIANGSYVVVRDEIETGPKEAVVRWTLLTAAGVEIVDKHKAVLTRDGKRLTLQVQEPAAVSLKTWSTEPTHEYDAPNPGTTRLGFEVTVPANAKGALTVLLIPESAEKSPVQPVQPLAQWPRP